MPLKSYKYVVIKLWLSDDGKVSTSMMHRNNWSDETYGKSENRAPDLTFYFYRFFDKFTLADLTNNEKFIVRDENCRFFMPDRDNVFSDMLQIFSLKYLHNQKHSNIPLSLVDKLVQLKLAERRQYPETKGFIQEDETPIDEKITAAPYYLSLFIECLSLSIGLGVLFTLNHIHCQNYLYYCSIIWISVSAFALFATLAVGFFLKEAIYNRKFIASPAIKSLLTQQSAIFKNVDSTPQNGEPRLENIYYYTEKRRIAREIALFCEKLESYILWECINDNISTYKTCAFVKEALTFLAEPSSQQSTTLNMYLLHKNVPKKVADYMTAYIEKHSDLTLVSQNRLLFDLISYDLQDHYLDKIKFRGGLIDHDPDEQEWSRDDDIHDPCNSKCFSFL